MVVNKKKKTRKLRASKTHGWGSPKKHRGSGSRGGMGKAGFGKKGAHKKTLAYTRGYGVVGSAAGFKRPGAKPALKAINISELERNLHSYLEKKIAKEEKGVIVIDISKIGYGKVLGSGNVKAKMKIIAKAVSAGAAEKVKAAGGEVVVEAAPESGKE